MKDFFEKIWVSVATSATQRSFRGRPLIGTEPIGNRIAQPADPDNCGEVDWMSLTDFERRQWIDSIGPEELGRRYGVRLVDQLNAMAAAEGPLTVAERASNDDWIVLVGFDGDQLADDEFFQMILAALDAAYPHAGALWCIADGPMDHLVGRDDAFALRFHQLRRDNAAVEGAFDAMQADLDSIGLDRGWWAGG